MPKDGTSDLDGRTALTISEINRLIDAVIAQRELRSEKRFKERQIFIAALGESRAEDALYEFLKNVSTCPPEVIHWCQNELAPTNLVAAA